MFWAPITTVSEQAAAQWLELVTTKADTLFDLIL